MSRHIHSRAKSCLVTGEHALNQTVKAKFLEFSIVRLYANPAVIIEYIGFLAIFMYHINQLFAKGNYKFIDKRHPVCLLFCTGHMGNMKLSLIDKILCRHGITVFFCKFIQCDITHCIIIGAPVREQIGISLAASPNPYKIVEHGGKPDYRCIRMGFTPVFHPAQHIFLGFRISGVNLHQMLLIPVVCGMVVHGNLFPDTVCQKADRIFMERSNSLQGNGTRLLLIAPFGGIYLFIGCSVINLPVLESSLAIVDGKLLCKETFQQRDCQFFSLCYCGRGAEKCLLQFIQILLRPLIVVTNNTNGGINSIPRMYNLIGKHGSVTVTNHICSPFFRHFQGKRLISGLAGKRKSTFLFCHFTISFIP